MANHLTFFVVLLLPISFAGSFAQSRKELRTKEMYQDKIIHLGHPMQFRSVDPSQVVQLSWQPRVFLYKGFLSEDECDYLISSVHGKITIQADDSAQIDEKNIHTDVGVSLDANDEIAKRIEERISAWTFLPEENSKPLKVLHFGPEGSKQNYNFIGNDETTEQVGEPLLATVIIYLSNVSQGGQILFPQAENKMWTECANSDKILRPTKGNAILFFNQHLNATPDGSSSHARCPILEGDLWCATKFFHLKGVKIEDPLSQYYGYADCSDEDENCSRWAAIGECERNSVFMIGSPDYYGTCRKSCNACR